MRGYAAVGLLQPKYNVNVGGVVRACGNYSVCLLAIQGVRFKKQSSDTMKHYRHMPLIQVEDLHTAIPYDCIPIGVELCQDAKPLPSFRHPERAFYVFGPEDGTLGQKTLSWCKDVVYIPTNRCMNLAATVNVVLYDRLAKQTN